MKIGMVGLGRMGSNRLLGAGQTGVRTIYTVGHSSRPVDELIDRLREVGVTRLVDIRTFPRSRTNPQSERLVHDRVEGGAARKPRRRRTR